MFRLKGRLKGSPFLPVSLRFESVKAKLWKSSECPALVARQPGRMLPNFGNDTPAWWNMPKSGRISGLWVKGGSFYLSSCQRQRTMISPCPGLLGVYDGRGGVEEQSSFNSRLWVESAEACLSRVKPVRLLIPPVFDDSSLQTTYSYMSLLPGDGESEKASCRPRACNSFW